MSAVEKRRGPAIAVVTRCSGCAFERSEYYCIEDGNDCDSGFTHDCAHPDAPRKPGHEMVSIGHGTSTPEWCPLLPDALAAFHLAALSPGARAALAVEARGGLAAVDADEGARVLASTGRGPR